MKFEDGLGVSRDVRFVSNRTKPNNPAPNSAGLIRTAEALRVFVLLTAVLAASCSLSASPPASGYSYVRPVLIDHRQVMNSDQTDFPLLIGGTFSYVATVANGGQVQNANGYDIVFTSDAAGQNQLDHEIDSYSPSTGTVAFWVRIPLLSHTSDTTIYMWYGNSGISTSQENKPGVWRNNYAGVWHFGGSSLSTVDSSVNANNGNNHGVTGVAGKFGEAGKFDGTGNTYFDIPSSNSFKPKSAITLEAWVNLNGPTSWSKIFSLDYRADGTWTSPWLSYALQLYNTSTRPSVGLAVGGNSLEAYGPALLPENQWVHMVDTYDGNQLTVYANGILVDATPETGPIDYGTSKDLAIGVHSPYTTGEALSGLIDEARISTVARSADWIATEYRNQEDPGTFFVICAAAPGNGQPAPCSAGGSGSPVSGYADYSEILIDHLKVSNTDQTDFPVLVSGKFSYLATVANGGQVQNANGYDIVFTSDAAGQSRLDHEIDSYDPTTGTVAFWVRVPFLSHTLDTPIYVWYGNSAVTTSQENKPGVWRNGYAGVWHLANSSGIVSTLDSTGNNSSSLVNVSTGTGQITGGGSFNGSSYVRVTNSTSFKPAGALSLEAWVNPSSVTAWNKAIDLDYRADGSWNAPYASYALEMNNNTQTAAFDVTTGASIYTVAGRLAVPVNSWSHIVGTFNGPKQAETLYVNGVQDSIAGTGNTTIDYGTSKDLTLGQRSPYSPGDGWIGLLDELRISNVVRSPDWIATEYQNQESPAIFYAVCAATPVGTAPPSCSTGDPVIDHFSPDTAPVGSQVAILGTGFGLTQGSSTVTFTTVNGTSTNYNVISWSDTQIVVVVPNIAVTGPVTITVGSNIGKSAGSFNVPPPQIASITPNLSGPGHTVTIAGSGFQATQTSGYGRSSLNFAWGGIPAISSWSDTQIVATVPSGTATGAVTVGVNGVYSNGFNFTVPSNLVNSVSPTSGPVGTQVTVTGTGFGATQGASTLTFNGQPPSSISSWSNTQIVATVPVTAAAGPVAVTVNNIQSNIDVWFNVPPPSISGFSPGGGVAGTQLTVNGSGFQANQRNSALTINGVAATVSSWSDTQIVATVPSSATTGPLLVTVNSVASGGNNTFSVPSPVITAVTQGACGPIGGTYTITGSGFTQTLGAVYVNGAQQSVVNANIEGETPMWSDTSITFILGANGSATSGPLTVQIFDATSNSVPFTVSQPSVSSVNPPEATVGDSVTVSGSGFCPTQGNSTVSIGQTTATVTSWSDSEFKATIAPGTSTSDTFNLSFSGVAVIAHMNLSVYTTTELTDSLGNSSTYKSVELGRSWFSESATGSGCSSCTVRGTISNTLGWEGELLTHTDELGHVTTYTYDSNANIASVSQQLDSNTPVTTSYTYNNFGEPLTVTDPLGNVTTNTYDARGNLLTVAAPAPAPNATQSVTTFAYNSLGELTQITDPLGNTTTLTYNPVGLIATITDKQNNVTTYGYDQHGNRTSITGALNNQTTFQYDAGDRLTEITYPDQSTVGFGYDGRGRRTSVTDQNSRTTSYAYDDADRLTSVTDAANNVTQYAYDTENNLLSITDANQNVTQFAYDAFGRVTQTTFPSTKKESYQYDAAGNLVLKTDRNGNAILYVYDALNRLMSKSYPDSSEVDYVYDLAGKIKQVTDPTGTYAMAYDNMGRLVGTTTTYSFLPSLQFSNSYVYDLNSNRTQLSLPDGSTETYHYDTLNRLTSITDSLTGQFTFGYDGLSRRTSLTRPNGVNTSYGYDSLSHLLSVLHQNGTNTLDGANYAYDAAGNRTSKSNLLNGITEQYTYDPLYQLTQVVQGATTTESYSYDPVGNRLSSIGMSYNYNTSNELTGTSAATYTYDANGNTLTKANGSGTTQYVWDFENRLTSAVVPSVGAVFFKYDPFGRRIQKVALNGTINYVYDGANAIEEVDGLGNLLAHYAQGSGIDEPLGELRSGPANFYEADALGSVTSLSSATASISTSYTYDTFGNATLSGSFVNPYRYTARDYDPETGLQYSRARYYDPSVGRFLNEDPMAFGAGPDFYVYANNAPSNLADPFGLQGTSVAPPAPTQSAVQAVIDYLEAQLEAEAQAAAQVAGTAGRGILGVIGVVGFVFAATQPTIDACHDQPNPHARCQKPQPEQACKKKSKRECDARHKQEADFCWTEYKDYPPLLHKCMERAMWRWNNCLRGLPDPGPLDPLHPNWSPN